MWWSQTLVKLTLTELWLMVCRASHSQPAIREQTLWLGRSAWHEEDRWESSSDCWEQKSLWCIWWQIFKNRRQQTSSLVLLCKELCSNAQQLCALTPALKITVTAGFRRNIFHSQTDKNKEPRPFGFRRHRAAACLRYGGKKTSARRRAWGKKKQKWF